MSKLRTYPPSTARVMSRTVLCFAVLVEYAAQAQFYIPGPLEGQNGWSGGAQPTFIQPINEAVSADAAYPGVQSWRYCDGSTHVGSGTPFSPGLSPAVAC